MMRYLAVRNYEHYQHYKDRRPPWVKLHASVLDDYAFTCLQDASKAHLMLLWLLASKLDNRIPYDPAWIARQLQASGDVDIETLVSQGFLEVREDASTTLAPRKQSAIVETETETETETDGARAEPALAAPVPDQPPSRASRPSAASKPGAQRYAPDFDAAWQRFPQREGSNSKREAAHAWTARLKAGVSADDLAAGVERYRAYCEARGITGTRFVLQASTFFGPGERYAESWALAQAPAVAVEERDGRGWMSPEIEALTRPPAAPFAAGNRS